MSSDANRFSLLTVPPARTAAEQALPPQLRAWFAATYGEPTAVQRCAWATIPQGQHLLLSSPTGSGKTLAAFLPILSQMLPAARPGLQCLYLAPLKALGRDVRANLKRNWRSIQQSGFYADIDLHIGLRTGDTSRRVRQRQIGDPPALLLTTPESLALMLSQPYAPELFRSLRWVVVDEIHALAGNKRGADLAISLERLTDLQGKENAPQRIGLSATCTPLTTVARFLVGVARPCTIAQVADSVAKQILVEPLFEKPAAASGWMRALLDRLDRELAAQRTTLIFTNTRNLAERVTWALRKRHPQRSEEIAAHHSSLSAMRRRVVERRLKQGRLWTVVSSTSLELGIDVGSVDSVVFVHPPGGVARFLQRMGRSGHRPDQPRRALLLTASAGELLESAVTAGSGRDGQIEPVRIIAQPLDVLCQQIVGMAMTSLWNPSAAFELIRQAAPYCTLTWDDFRDCLDYLSGRLRDGTSWLPARLVWEGDCFTIADDRIAKLLRRNLGSILAEDACAIRLRLSSPEENEDLPSTQMVGEIDAVYAERLQPGDRFVLDGRCLEMKERENAALLVDEVFGRPQVPRWLGSGVPMPIELARRIYLFRVQAAEALRDGRDALRELLARDFHLDLPAVAALEEYLLRQETVSEIPSLTTLLIECVSMQSCQEYYLHTPLPRSANEVLARVMVQRRKQAGAAAIMAVAGNLGIYVLAFACEPLTPEIWRAGLRAERFAEDFLEHLNESDLVREHFARVAQTGLMVLRNPAGRKRKVGGKDWTARRLYAQIRARVHDFVLLRQTEREAQDGLCDLATAHAYATELPARAIRLRHLSETSPLGESLLRFSGQSEPITSESKFVASEK